MEKPNKTNSTKSFVSDLVAGTVASICSKTAAAPIERIKILLQTQKVNSGLTLQYTGPIDCVRRVYHEQGVRSFWRGNLANVLRNFPNQAFTFALKDRYRQFFLGKLGNKSFWSVFWGNLLSSGTAAATCLLAVYPLDMARVRLATDVGSAKDASRKFAGLWDCLKQTYIEGGSSSSSSLSSSSSSGGFSPLRGAAALYKGMAISMVGVVLFKALYLGGYDIAKTHWGLWGKEEEKKQYGQMNDSSSSSSSSSQIIPRSTNNSRNRNDSNSNSSSSPPSPSSTSSPPSSIYSRFLAAQLVTLVSGTLCYPIDTVKRRVMMQTREKEIKGNNGGGGGGGTGGGKGKLLYSGGLDCFRKVIRQEGFLSLYSGLSVNIVRSFAGALLLVGYDEMKFLLEPSSGHRDLMG